MIGFLKHYKLDGHFKLNIEPNHTTMAGHSYAHDCDMASRYGFLGSIDSNTGDTSLGWDTDQFPMNLKDCASLVRIVLQQGGIAPGGLNFDAKVRRESTDPVDLFIAHIGAMDCFALALRRMAVLHAEGTLNKMISERYASFDSGLGARIEKGEASLEECTKAVLALPADQQEPKVISGQQEKYESIFNNYLHQ